MVTFGCDWYMAHQKLGNNFFPKQNACKFHQFSNPGGHLNFQEQLDFIFKLKDAIDIIFRRPAYRSVIKKTFMIGIYVLPWFFKKAAG